MRSLKIVSLMLLLGLSFHLASQEPQLAIEHSVKVEFPTQPGFDYTVYSTTDPAQQTGWEPLGMIGNVSGDRATFFYQTSSDQKLFFKVEAEPASIAPPGFQSSSILPITRLPAGTTPGAATGPWQRSRRHGPSTGVRGAYGNRRTRWTGPSGTRGR